MGDRNMFDLSDSESNDNDIQPKVDEGGDQNEYQDNENIINNNTNNVDGFTYENDFNPIEYDQPQFLDEQNGQDGQQNGQDGQQNGYFPQQYQPPFIPEMNQQVIQGKDLFEQIQPIDPIADSKMEQEEQVDQQQGQPQQQMQQEQVDQGQNLDNLNLNYDHLQDEPLLGQQQQPQQAQPGPTTAQAVTIPRSFYLSYFQNLFSEQNKAGKILCPPPPHFNNFASMNSLAPPSLEIIQKNKQFFSLGKIIDFSSIYANPKNLVTQEELSTVNDLISHGKNKYDVMQELVSSIMNKTIEILKHTSRGGMQLKDYIDDLDLLVKKLAILCKITKIKLAKIQIKNIFENEKKLFERSTKQIENSLQQIVNFQNALNIPEILSNQNPV